QALEDRERRQVLRNRLAIFATGVMPAAELHRRHRFAETVAVLASDLADLRVLGFRPGEITQMKERRAETEARREPPGQVAQFVIEIEGSGESIARRC